MPPSADWRSMVLPWRLSKLFFFLPLILKWFVLIQFWPKIFQIRPKHSHVYFCTVAGAFQQIWLSQPIYYQTICPWEYLGRIWKILGQNWIRTNHFKIRGKKKKSLESRHGNTIVRLQLKAANSNGISSQLSSKYF